MMTPLEARLTEEVATLRARNQEQEIIIKLLREKVDLLVRKVFGKSSEALDEQQLLLLLQGDEASTKSTIASADTTGLEAELAQGDKELKAKRARTERKPRIPEHLPVSEAPRPLGRGRDRRSAA